MFKSSPIAKSAAKAITEILANGPQTGKDLGISTALMRRAEKAGYVKVKTTRKHGTVEDPSKGRPEIVWALTDKGRGKAKRMTQTA